LVLLDLRFVHGEINEFGDPQIGSVFGLEVLLPMMRQEFGDDLPIVVLSSTPKDQMNVAVRAGGALDFIQRIPGVGAQPDEGRTTLQRTLFAHGLIEDPAGIVVGKTLPTLKMLRQARRGAMAARNILLLGETGTGKGLLANYIHRMSSRRNGPFEAFHAAHRPAELQADELFGHWRGAFTGADRDASGILERASGGTLFIDEVADIDLRVQQMLMQPIEERSFRCIGIPPKDRPASQSLDALVILATNRDLYSASADGAFKNDFLNRINAFSIMLPPLRERREDLPLLIDQLVKILAPGWLGRFLPEAIETMQQREWKNGNIRELRNIIEHAIANNPHQDITKSDVAESDISHCAPALPPNRMPDPSSGSNFPSGLALALGKDIQQLSMQEIEDMKQRLAGEFPKLLGQSLIFALNLTQNNGKLNPTAASRFLLGNPELTTMQAKQFIKRLLDLDTINGKVSEAFCSTSLYKQHDLLQGVVTSLTKKQRGGKRKQAESS
jgi:DNA-binding NtrC family response regulator